MADRRSASDALWHERAVIYDLPVRSFYDANADGSGDFPGLAEKLDYLEGLGVTCLWLPPFFQSPQRDDGYDISDHRDVHPSYGTLDDVKRFLEAAHERRLKVVIELVLNHTSDQHRWFRRAREAPPGSVERDFYVWSDRDDRYRDARVLLAATERSNWTWDPQARAYYWHRFHHYEPDLNFDNPAVVQEMLGVLDFWLELGVDGFRLDAVAYLAEREGTSCENLPESHAIVKAIRRHIDEHWPHRVLMAGTPLPPGDVRAWFGDGDECHVASYAPLMPRILMGLQLEDRQPIVEMMRQAPAIPESCQWALFLLNHEDVAVDAVSDDERDFMHLASSADRSGRQHLVARRRLAPLVGNNRRRIELLNSLLFSLPGAPVVYYGDEIGMGDNVYLGERNGVRTPMQWTSDRNARFSRADPARLYCPVVMDPIYGYQSVNVEAQERDASSLLQWIRNLIGLRKQFAVLGAGGLRLLEPTNRKVLAYVREDGHDAVLCVANLSRAVQPVELDLTAFAGVTPIEALGYTEFPTIGRAPYFLTLGPYGFYWFELQSRGV